MREEIKTNKLNKQSNFSPIVFYGGPTVVRGQTHDNSSKPIGGKSVNGS